MSIPQLPAEGADRARWVKIAAAAWLLLVSVLAVVNSVGLSRLAEQSQASAQDAHVQALNTRVAELEQQSAASKSQPKPVAPPDFEAARKALDERLSQVEQAQAADSRAGDLQALLARVGDIEARLKKVAAPAATPRRTAEALKPKAPEPPFSVAGLELRGGERFLSIAAPGVASVRELRLLREGDAIGAWQLQAIEAHAAVFRVDGQTQRIALP
ncbi:hypothetical protein I5F78_04420 [Pseudomonas aeruginosa]|nr:hypothetical protein [Pseudomonas aeruginosa]